MARLIAIELLLFLLPWGVWWLRKGRGRGFADAPHLKLLILGTAFVLIGLVPFALTPGPGSGGRYVPAHFEDGVFIPDHFEP